jgi:hypothetical protein
MLLALSASCHESTAPDDPVGKYVLASVDAKTLPVTMYSDTGYSLIVTAGALTLTADQKYSGTITTKETVDGVASVYVDQLVGTWVQFSNGSVAITPTGGAVITASLAAGKLTVPQSDGVYAYTRSP